MATRPKTTSKLARKAPGLAVFALIGVTLAWVSARLATFAVEHGGFSIQAFMSFSGALPGDFMARPFHLLLSNPTVVACAVVPPAALVIVALLVASKGEKLDNEDTGAEHGNDRLATMSEIKSFSDKKNFCNNVLYSENCHLAMQPHDKRTKAVLDGRNLNCITLGISGLGKTYNLVWPDLMQSIGTALEPMPYGWRNVPEHFKASRAYKTLLWLRSLVSKGDAGTLEAEPVEQGGEEPIAIEGKEPSEQADKEPRVHVEYADARSRFSHIVPETLKARAAGLAESYRDQVGSSSKAEKRRRAQEAIEGGYDVFNTDPKGDNVRDVGPMYEKAGVKVKVIDTIDFRNGLRFNPFAYIKRHAVDCRPVEETLVKVKVVGPAAPKAEAGEIELDLTPPECEGLHPGSSAEQSAGGEPVIGTRRGKAMWVAGAAYSMQTERWGTSELPQLTMEKDEIDRRLAEAESALEIATAKNLEDEAVRLSKELEELSEQMNVWWMHNEMGSYTVESDDPDKTAQRVAGTGCSDVAKTIETFSYKRSTGTVEISFKNLSANNVSARVEIDLDDSLVVDRIEEITCGEVEWPCDDDGTPLAYGKLVWNLTDVEPRMAYRGKHASELKNDINVADKLVLHVHVRTEFVADGVDLTKIVDCLVSNLRGTDAKSNGSEDPFWEDTKRLCFMSLTAFLFERYAPQYQTLPEVMRLLDMALSDSGNPEDPSPLQCLMEQWEYGRVYGAAATDASNGRYAAPSSSWQKASNISHSRNNSIALHCYHAFMNGAPETVQSVIISCQACLVNLVTEEAKDFLSDDELELDTLGDPGQKQVIFCVTKDTNSPFDFITALVVYLAIDLAQDKAYKVYGGKLPRHVRFVLDEAANIGKIPILIRALAVVRSRNISISMYLQSKAQLALVYGKEETEVVFDNCSTIVYLGAQSEETRKEMSERVGKETVQSRRFQRSFNSNSMFVGSASESIASNERPVISASKMGQLEKGHLLVFLFNAPGAIFDHKYKTRQHPYYAYINPRDERSLFEPLPRVEDRFDYQRYLSRQRAEREGVVYMGGK